MEEIETLRPRDPSKKHVCRECGEGVTGGAIVQHLQYHHKMTVAEYRIKHNIPSQSQNRKLVLQKAWAARKGVSPVNKKYINSETEITCCVCETKRMRPTWLVETYKARGIVDHTCGKKKCISELRSRKLKIARNTPESQANTSAASKKMWKVNHATHAAACQKGMQASPKYAKGPRMLKAAATRALQKQINPAKYSEAVRRSWNKREHKVFTPVTFICASCKTKVDRLLDPTKYARFMKAKVHVCNSKCNGQYKKAHTLMATRPCGQCGTAVTRRKALIDYLEKKGRKLFFCCRVHQREYQDLHGKMRDTIPELQVKAFLAEYGIAFDQTCLIHFTGASKPQRWTIPDFTVGKVLVYVDGCAVHGCPVCGCRGFKNNKVKDPLITSALQALGYSVTRIWEHELKGEAWKTKITEALNPGVKL